MVGREAAQPFSVSIWRLWRFGQFDLGPAAAFSVLYFLLNLLLCYLFYSSVVRRPENRCGRAMNTAAQTSPLCRAILYGYCVYLLVPLYWLINMSLRTNGSIAAGVEWVPAAPTLANFQEIFTNPVWSGGFANSLSYVAINSVLSLVVAIPAAFVFLPLSLPG